MGYILKGRGVFPLLFSCFYIKLYHHNCLHAFKHFFIDCVDHTFMILLVHAQRDVEVEMAENDTRQKRVQGTDVKYGDSIQLQHTLTGRYVCASITDTSITSKSKLKVYTYHHSLHQFLSIANSKLHMWQTQVENEPLYVG